MTLQDKTVPVTGANLTDPAVLERHLAVNLFGTHAVTQAFLPAPLRSRGASRRRPRSP